MTGLVTCDAMIDPFEIDGSDETIGVQLNFELREGAANAEALFESFLDALPGTQFFLYRRDGLNLRKVGKLDRLGEQPPGARQAIMDWLKKREAPWHATRPQDGQLTSADQLSKGQLLAGAQTWPAPLPQDAGLNVLVRHSARLPEADLSGDLLYLVPFPWLADGQEPKDPLPIVADASRPDKAWVQAPWGDDKPSLQVASLTKYAPADGVDESGFLAVDSIGKPQLRVAEALRRKAAGLFWTAPQLIALAPPVVEGDEPAHRSAALRSLANRTAHAVASLLDTLLLALVMPGRANKADPPVALGPIVQSVLAAAEEVRAEDEAAAEGDEPTPNASWYDLHLEQFPRDVRLWVAKLAADWTTCLKWLARLLDRPELIADIEKQKWRETLEQLQSGQPILALLLEIATSGDQIPDPGAEFDFTAADAQADQELAELVQVLGEEKGFEGAILQFLRHASLSDDAGAQTLLASLFRKRDDATDEKAASYVAGLPARLITTISAYYDAHYNALEAARQAVGRVFASAYLDAVREAADGAMPKIEADNWFRLRLTRSGDDDPATLFDDIRAVLHVFDPPLADPDRVLGTAWRETCADLGVGELAADRRFTPDSYPADLPVLMPLPPVRQELDPFEQQFDGVGLLVRRTGTNGSDWAHVCRVRLKTDEPAILPAQPAFEDGERSLTFEYRGHHLVFDQLDDPDDDDDDKTAANPYYQPSPPALADDEPKPPALAYGTDYQLAAYAVSRNGILPEAVSLEGDVAQRHRPRLQLGELEDAPRQTFSYSRRTGIGKAVLQRANGDASASRFDRNSVLPLAFDYPRAGLNARPSAKVWADLWRRDDGSGGIALPETDRQSVKVRLKDVTTAGEGSIGLALLTTSAPEPAAMTFASIDLSDLAETVQLSITRVGDEVVLMLKDGEQDIELGRAPAGSAGWIRMQLESADGDAAVTYADPTGEPEGSSSGDARDGKDFVLLRPDDDRIWTREYPSTASYSLLPPSMAPTDLDRWLNNPELLEAACGDRDGQALADAKKALGSLQILLLGMAHSKSDQVAELLRRHPGFLPDLAIEKLQAELIVLDGIGKGSGRGAESIVEPVPLPFLPDLIEAAGGVPIDDDGFIISELLEAFITGMVRERGLTVHIQADPANRERVDLAYREESAELAVTVPSGSVAMLRLRVAVSKSHFDVAGGKTPIIDGKFRQFATGETDAAFLFEGPNLRIEVMEQPDRTVAGDLLVLADQGLDTTSATGSRAYQVRFHPGQDAVWQWCGRAEVSSQRWRHLGRAQTAWFEPLKNNIAAEAGKPVIAIPENHDGLSAFEQEAFYGREDDIQIATVRLEPLGAASVLHEGEWELPSATMFRHRVTLRNRYARAMMSGEGRRWPIVPQPADADAPDTVRPNWLRVVVLADRSRLQLSRPQLRAIMPLSVAERGAASPPLLAMLAEPPFADGGLADRVAAGVATAIGYEMQDVQGEEMLGVGDTRQEFGPDPQHGYTPLAKDLNGAIGLDGAGPIGMTHDSAAGTSTAFANSAWLLTPTALVTDGKHDFQEHFASVSLQRYLDPAWIMRADPATVALPAGSEKKTGTAFSQALWFEVKDAGTSVHCGKLGVVQVDRNGDDWVAWTTPRLILPEAPQEEDRRIELARFSAAGHVGVALMHQPLDDARATMSVFATEPRRAPRLMASFRWHADTQAKEDSESGDGGSDQAGEDDRAQRTIRFVVGGDDKTDEALGTSASLVTDMHWARTGSDTSHLAALGLEAEEATPVPIEDISISGSDIFAADGAKLWLRPSLHDTKVPLYKHRFLAWLPTRETDGPGRAMQVYDPATPARALFAKELGTRIDMPGALVHLLEIECPARPVGSEHADGIPPEYLKSSFDLRDFGIEDVEDHKWLIAMVRPSGKHRTIADKNAMVHVVSETGRATIALSGDVADMIVLAINRDGRDHSAWQIDGEGRVGDLEVSRDSVIGGDHVAFEVEASEEWWVSIAVLSAGRKPAGPHDLAIDFDWFFGALADAGGETVENSLSHEGLRSTRAAQARVLSISGPIRVQS